MDIGLFAPLRSPVCTPEWLKDFGPGCESVGLRSVWMGEHVVLFEAYESRYPGSEDGKFSFPEKSGLLDMTSTLSFLAACTTTLRLGTGIRILPQANPVYTAKEYATLDFISGGRLDFGVGVWWAVVCLGGLGGAGGGTRGPVRRVPGGAAHAVGRPQVGLRR